MKGLRGAGLLLVSAACVHLTPFTPRALSGQRFPLRPGWSLALALDGSVGGHKAVIHLAVEEPLSRVTDGCYDSAPNVVARVRMPGPTTLADGGPDVVVEEQVVASDVRLAGRTLGDVRALRDADAGCDLTLGSEVLVGFVLEVDPGARTVTFHAETPPPPKYQAEESLALELALDPRTDRPSLAVQLDTTGSPLTLPMLLATASERVQVSAAAGRALEGKDVGARAPRATFSPRSLALAPGWELHHVVVTVLPDDAPAGEGPPLPAAPPSGVLGADAWGHFRTLIDLRGQQLVLYRRPPPVEGGAGPQSWTQLSSDSTRDGTLVRFISWQMLDSGGQVPLEPAHVGVHSCRVGLTLGPEDPGASLEVAIPWEGLEEALPECARELASVPAWTGELGVAFAHRPCSGTCLYAQALPVGRTVCACSGRSPVAASAAPARPPAAPSVPAPEAGEPRDPGKPPPH